MKPFLMNYSRYKTSEIIVKFTEEPSNFQNAGSTEKAVLRGVCVDYPGHPGHPRLLHEEHPRGQAPQTGEHIGIIILGTMSQDFGPQMFIGSIILF